jgi:hypothetical protein
MALVLPWIILWTQVGAALWVQKDIITMATRGATIAGYFRPITHAAAACIACNAACWLICWIAVSQSGD